MNQSQWEDFATRHTAAWCSQNAASVAAFFAEDGVLQINDGIPAVGRVAITAAAQEFMRDFPDLTILLDGITLEKSRVLYRWTLIGTNTGPGGTGNPVRISGYDEWTMGADNLLAKSIGYFDEADYQRQLNVGSEDR